VTEWHWITEEVICAIHDAQIVEYGGAAGILNSSVLASALGRPQNLLAYGDPDPAALAACYMVAIARAHGFVDGNKRTALAAGWFFLQKHGYTFSFDSDEQGEKMMVDVAEGRMSEERLAAWLRNRIVPDDQ
jgi:death on curing protein